jgi:hypothetical protein
MPLTPFPRLVRLQTKLTHTILLLLLFLSGSLARAALLDPLDFTSLGTFNVTNGGYIIDTDALTISQTNGVSTNLLFTGVIDNQGGQADSFGPGAAVTNIGPLGIPHLAVFTFDDLALAGTANITVTGHRALGLLSRGNILIDRTLDLSASGITAGPGGFNGGFADMSGAQDGSGPGGGESRAGALSFQNYGGGGGGFGSAGYADVSITNSFRGAGGPAYGDLTENLQAGSGGGGALSTAIVTPGSAKGGGGGGALEITAVGLVQLGSNSVLRLDGGDGAVTTRAHAGSGSGGGVRLSGAGVFPNGTISAQGAKDDNGFGGGGGGGRVLIEGMGIYSVGTPLDPLSLIAGINVAHGGGPALILAGVITVVPYTTLVPLGQTLEIAPQTLQVATATNPAVELVIGNLYVFGEVTVPSGGVTHKYEIQLAPAASRITGTNLLTIAGSLAGSGVVEVPVKVAAGGELNLVNDIITFPGDGIGATDDGLVNLGTANLINSVIHGDVRSPAGSTNNVAGSATFNGHFKGAASFSGTQNLVTFNGGYDPGDSPAAVNFGGSVAFGSGGTLTMELGGTSAGTQYDQLNVTATANFGGTLNVVLINGFVPAAGQVFQLFNAASRVGSFTTVNLPALNAGLAWNNQIGANGAIAVVAAPGGSPQFGTVTRSGSDLIFSGTGGAANGDYVVLSSTNVAAPLLNWLPVTSNLFDASGNFIFTNPINPARPQEFYRLKQP